MRLALQSTVRSILLAALALLSVSILIERATAVEVTGGERVSTSGQPTSDSPSPRPVFPPPSQDCFILASRSFSIPFTVDKSGSRPVEVRLYLSHGPDDRWRMLSHKRPDVAVPQFEFTAKTDGEFWFATRTIDSEGNPHPNDDIQPQLKVYIDTAKPLVELAIDADANGRVVASLTVHDATPIKDILLRYVTDKSKEWQSAEANKLLADGSIQFVPTQYWERMSIQLIATDKAGNRTVVNRLLQRPRVAKVPTNRYGTNDLEARTAPYRLRPSEQTRFQAVSGPVDLLDRRLDEQVQFRTYPHPKKNPPASYSTGTPTSPFGIYRGGALATRPTTPSYVPSANQTVHRNAGVRTDHGAAQHQDNRPAQNNTRPRFDPPVPISNGVDMNGPQRLAPSNPQADLTLAPEEIPAPEAVPVPEAVPAPITGAENGTHTKIQAEKPKQSQPRSAAEAMRPMTEKSVVPEREIIPTPRPKRHRTERPIAPAQRRAPIRHSDSERFSLDYELQAVGSLGVDAIELYGSVDGGETWSLWGTDPDRVSPFDIETKESGVFSFRIVVVGRNGLTSPRPQSGEMPDIVVVVDKNKPKVRITAAQYGEGNRIGALVIRYECRDPNLGPRPISLSFSDSTNGPWTTIAAGLRNDGDYVWPADPKLPRQIYLRIDAKDGAGNVGTYILDTPIDVQGLAPRARIRGFQSLSGMEPFPLDEQTAGRPGATFK